MGGSNMDVKALRDIPPWEWPAGAGKIFLDILRGGQAAEADRLLAAELAGDFTVINDELADALLSILRSDDEPEKLRGQAAISLGPVLEHADVDGLEEADDVPIEERTFHRIQESLSKLYMVANEALPSIRPRAAAKILDDLTESDDEDIVEAVSEAMVMAEGLADEEDERRH